MHSEHSRIKSCDANSDLWNSGIESNKDIVRKRKRKIRYISNILVISDPKKPENEGKVFLFGYGAKIFEKLMSAIKPEFEDETAFNPFDLWTGAPFKLKIRRYEGFRNYDKSEFDICSQLFEDESVIEKVWMSEYPLKGFIDPKEFKSYDELKKKFNSITGVETIPSAVSSLNEEEEWESNTPNTIEVSRKGKEKAHSKDESEEESFALYKHLLEDD